MNWYWFFFFFSQTEYNRDLWGPQEFGERQPPPQSYCTHQISPDSIVAELPGFRGETAKSTVATATALTAWRTYGQGRKARIPYTRWTQSECLGVDRQSDRVDHYWQHVAVHLCARIIHAKLSETIFFSVERIRPFFQSRICAMNRKGSKEEFMCIKFLTVFFSSFLISLRPFLPKAMERVFVELSSDWFFWFCFCLEP